MAKKLDVLSNPKASPAAFIADLKKAAYRDAIEKIAHQIAMVAMEDVITGVDPKEATERADRGFARLKTFLTFTDCL